MPRVRLVLSLLVLVSLASCGLLERPPTAAFSVSPSSGAPPLAVTLDASASRGRGAPLTAYDWRVVGAGVDERLAGREATVTLDAAGSYDVTLTVTDEAGRAAVSSRLVTVLEPAEAVAPMPASLALRAVLGGVGRDAFEVGNLGDLPLAVSVAAEGAPAWLSVEPAEAEAPGDGFARFDVAGACGDVEASHAATLVVTTDDPDEPRFEVPVALDCVAAPPSQFAIELLFEGSGFTASRQAVFRDAAARWAEVVIGDLADGDLSVPPSWCDDDGYAGPVDDLIIRAVLEPIDGPYGVLGEAGPCVLRASDGTPAYGMMRFDSDDVAIMEAGGTFRNVILHEMGHVLGVGALWGSNALLRHDGPDCLQSSTVGYIGLEGARSWGELGGAGDAPVEDNGQPGTACAHWDEETFSDELMTGYASIGAAPLSRLTVGSLEDLGYEVAYQAADPYGLPACSPNCLRASGAPELHTVPLRPLPPGAGFVPAPPR